MAAPGDCGICEDGCDHESWKHIEGVCAECLIDENERLRAEIRKLRGADGD